MEQNLRLTIRTKRCGPVNVFNHVKLLSQIGKDSILYADNKMLSPSAVIPNQILFLSSRVLSINTLNRSIPTVTIVTLMKNYNMQKKSSL